ARRILVVDDEPLVLDGIKALLERLGYTNVELADRAKEALGRLENGDNPELILLDLNMPEVDGMAFVRGLVERNYRGHLILVSGAVERLLKTVKQLIRAHGIDVLGHLQKPVPREAQRSLMLAWKPRPERSSRPGRTK